VAQEMRGNTIRMDRTIEKTYPKGQFLESLRSAKAASPRRHTNQELAIRQSGARSVLRDFLRRFEVGFGGVWGGCASSCLERQRRSGKLLGPPQRSNGAIHSICGIDLWESLIVAGEARGTPSEWIGLLDKRSEWITRGGMASKNGTDRANVQNGCGPEDFVIWLVLPGRP